VVSLMNEQSICLEELFFMLHDTFIEALPNWYREENAVNLEKIIRSLSQDIMGKLDVDST